MKKNALSCFIIFFLMACSLSVSAGDQWIFDSEHSYVLWQIKHFDFSVQTGKWYTTGSFILDPKKPENSKVNASIQIASVISGVPSLDKHLKSELFFDAGHFPVATFVSSKVVMTGQSTAKVSGILTLHGVSKPVLLNVKLNHKGLSPITDKMTMGFSAETILKRSDFAITTLLPGLADEVKIMIEVEASPKST